MGRNSRNITQQLNKRIDSLLRIGEKKIKDDATNPNRVEGIHSIKTAETYRSVAHVFGEYLKSQGIRNIYDIRREHIEGFMHSRENLSAYTHSKDIAAINKILDTRYTLRDFGFSNRSYKEISNNRGIARYDTGQAARNSQALEFVRACGMRRASIGQIKPSDFIRDEKGQCIGVHLIEKGGRERYAVILQEYRERITQQVNQSLEQNGDKPFIRAPDANSNPHWYRGEYAQHLYSDLLAAKESGQDYYCGMREKFINEDNFNKAISRYHNDIVRGYDKTVMAEISQNLGHNRIDVVMYHYLMK